MALLQDVQTSHVGDLVTLFQVDCTNFADGTILYFTPNAYLGAPVLWNGNLYTPVDIDADGFEYNVKGAFPTPTLRMSNVTNLASSLVIAFDDLIGAKVVRIRTFKQYLDNGTSPDVNQIFPPDVYIVEQKTTHNKKLIEWKLSASIDQDGAMLPGFFLVRDYCSRIFRRWDAVKGEFRYEQATCPYVGAAMFDINNNPTGDPTQDACAKNLPACKLHFGATNPLPYKGIPSLGRQR